MLRFQELLMNSCGVVMAKAMPILQQKSDELIEYCKTNAISEDTFNHTYAHTVCKILCFRRQFISIIATLCCRHTVNQDFVRNHGIIEILLNMTKIDPFTMFLQQWSIFAIKHITENHQTNQCYIMEIKAQKVIQDEHMKKMGIQVTYDEISGKLTTKQTGPTASKE